MGVRRKKKAHVSIQLAEFITLCRCLPLISESNQIALYLIKLPSHIRSSTVAGSLVKFKGNGKVRSLRWRSLRDIDSAR